MNIDTKVKNIIQELKNSLNQEVAAHIRRIILFGSRVRGESTQDSDLDILILLDKKDSNIENQLEESVYQVMWNHDFQPILSLKIDTETHFQKALSKDYSFYRNIQNEGISV